jgi:hypothetical protein
LGAEKAGFRVGIHKDGTLGMIRLRRRMASRRDQKELRSAAEAGFVVLGWPARMNPCAFKAEADDE